METRQILIEWAPIGLRSVIEANETILDAARLAGIQLSAICGGSGTCGACKVYVHGGKLSPLTASEKKILSSDEIQKGARLACQAVAFSDVKIYLPPESLTTEQRLQTEGEIPFLADNSPRLWRIPLSIPQPSILDLRSDEKRICDALLSKGYNDVSISFRALNSLSEQIRELNWNFDCILNENLQAIAFLPLNAPIFSLAVDIGTTKIAAYLLDLETKRCVKREGIPNPQIIYGEDVISRIAFSNKNPDGRKILQEFLINSINQLVLSMAERISAPTAQIVDAVFVCNTAIHHFFLNFPVRQLGMYPYVPAASRSMSFSAEMIGLHINPSADVYLPENIAGFVGADHVAMLLGSDSKPCGKNIIAMDIGTNTEISLITAEGEYYCCSCASGPAFEGAHIKHGMRASKGAIEKARVLPNGEVRLQTIGNFPALGICGSGILDLIAELKKNGAINEQGKFNRDFPGVIPYEKNFAFRCLPAEKTGTDHDILLTRSDINEIILAKSAIRAGLEILLRSAKLSINDIQNFIIAGAFGSYLDVKNAIEIGLFPDAPLDSFKQTGNAAGTGAQMLALSSSARQSATSIVVKETYIELTVFPDFQDILLDFMNLNR